MLKVKTDRVRQRHVSFYRKVPEAAVCPTLVNCSSSATGLLLIVCSFFPVPLPP